MEDPVTEIPPIIHSLTQSAPSSQRLTLEKYFTPNASFTHPLCRTGSFEGSRWLIWCVYRWYKIMSPRIEIKVEGVAYNPQTLTLYVSTTQLFRLWILPPFLPSTRVSLVTVLKLVPSSTSTSTSTATSQYPPSPTPPRTYKIQSQTDFYQPSELVKFFSPLGILALGVVLLQLGATAMCVLGAVLGWPVTWVEENVLGGNRERGWKEVVKG